MARRSSIPFYKVLKRYAERSHVLSPVVNRPRYSSGPSAGRAIIDAIDLLCTTEVAPPGYGESTAQFDERFDPTKEPTAPHLSDYIEHYRSPEISAARYSATPSANNINYAIRTDHSYDSDDNTISLNIEIDIFKVTHTAAEQLAIPSILYDRETDPELTRAFERAVLSDAFFNLYALAVDEMKKTRKPGNEIILKDEKNEIVAREDDIFNAIEETADKLSLRLKELNKAEAEPKLTETKPDPANKTKKRKKSKTKKGSLANKLKKIKFILDDGFYSKYWMTEDTEYDVEKTDEYSKSIHSGKINRSPYSIVLNNALAAQGAVPILLNRKTIDGIVRTHYLHSIIYHLISSINVISWLAQNAPGTYSPDREASLLIKIALSLTQLGVANHKINKILMAAVIENRHMIAHLTRVPKKHTDESPSLRAFIGKIAMPIDISETASSSEKIVAARLRDLGRMLADKHGVTYSPQPGNVVLDVLRKADDVDEVMVDVTQAIEDCFNLINNAPPTSL